MFSFSISDTKTSDIDSGDNQTTTDAKAQDGNTKKTDKNTIQMGKNKDSNKAFAAELKELKKKKPVPLPRTKLPSTSSDTYSKVELRKGSSSSNKIPTVSVISKKYADLMSIPKDNIMEDLDIIFPYCKDSKEISKAEAAEYLTLIDNYEPPPKASKLFSRKKKSGKKSRHNKKNDPSLELSDINNEGYTIPAMMPRVTIDSEIFEGPPQTSSLYYDLDVDAGSLRNSDASSRVGSEVDSRYSMDRCSVDRSLASSQDLTIDSSHDSSIGRSSTGTARGMRASSSPRRSRSSGGVRLGITSLRSSRPISQRIPLMSNSMMLSEGGHPSQIDEL